MGCLSFFFESIFVLLKNDTLFILFALFLYFTFLQTAISVNEVETLTSEEKIILISLMNR